MLLLLLVLILAAAGGFLGDLLEFAGWVILVMVIIGAFLGYALYRALSNALNR
jgi:hypothetical protein